MAMGLFVAKILSVYCLCGGFVALRRGEGSSGVMHRDL